MGLHYVPDRYLRGFECPDKPGYIWMYDKAKSSSNCLPIKVVAQSPGFYSPEVEEELNFEVELPGNHVIDKLNRGERIDEMERRDLTYYIATMMRRVPRARAKAEKLIPPALAEI